MANQRVLQWALPTRLFSCHLDAFDPRPVFMPFSQIILTSQGKRAALTLFVAEPSQLPFPIDEIVKELNLTCTNRTEYDESPLSGDDGMLS